MLNREKYVYPYGLEPREISRVVPIAARMCISVYRNPESSDAERITSAQRLIYATEIVSGFENLCGELFLNLTVQGADTEAAGRFAILASEFEVFDKFIPTALTNGNDQKFLRSILAI